MDCHAWSRFRAGIAGRPSAPAHFGKAQQRFAALAKVEERHLRHCNSVLATLAA
jgi:hypothetical protein